jgi:phosphatidate cytidylyltransferase
MRRIVTAIVLIPFVSYVVLWGPQWLCLLVIAVVGLLCYHEYTGIIANYGIRPLDPVGYGAGLVVLLVQQQEMLTVTLLAVLALALAARAYDLAKGLLSAAALLLGVLYIFGAWRAGFALFAAGREWLFFVLVLNWIGDTLAFVVGKAAGRHKLATRISPAKSWEGAITSLVSSIVFGMFYLGWFVPSITLGPRIVLSAAANIAGQIGDLAESAMKRGAGVKDSGTLLPGHGGWLDRLDSALFAMPVVYLFLMFPWWN